MSLLQKQSRWYLIHCKPRQDERAHANLERQRFECFRPLRRVEKIQMGRKREILESLFPRYVFIRLSIQDNWVPVASTLGVDRIVRFGEFPVPVADEIIKHIRRRMEWRSVKEPYLKPGERVVITEGSFSQVEAIFVAGDGDERVMLLMNILHSEQTLSFPLTSVKKL
jgi:transcriptional antiterminator RfaH